MEVEMRGLEQSIKTRFNERVPFCGTQSESVHNCCERLQDMH